MTQTWDTAAVFSALAVPFMVLLVREIVRHIPSWRVTLATWVNKVKRGIHWLRGWHILFHQSHIDAKEAEIKVLADKVEALTLQLMMAQRMHTFLATDTGARQLPLVTRHNGNGKHTGNGKHAAIEPQFFLGRPIVRGYVITKYDTQAHGSECWGIPLDEARKREIDHLVKVKRNGRVQWVPELDATQAEIEREWKLLEWKEF